MDTTPAGGPTTSGAFDATSAGQLVATAGGAALTYNAAQQLTGLVPASGPSVAFEYDGNGSRTSSAVAAVSPDPALTTEYAYTPTGALALVTTPAATVGYTVDGRGLRQSRTVGLTTDDFTWSTVCGLPVLLEDGDRTYLYGPSITPIAQVGGGGDAEYLHGDLLGSVRAITDDTGAVTGRSDFDAFGARTAHTGIADSTFGFTGSWTDPDTGLLHLRARDYDPATGQFLTVDPAVDSTRQPYAYTGNNPLLLTDPSGLEPCSYNDWACQNQASRSAGPSCSYNDWTCQNTPAEWNPDAFAENGMAFWAGTSEGVGFNVPMLMDCTLHNRYSGNGFYWAGDVLGVLLAVATLTAGADMRIGTALASRQVPVNPTSIGMTISRQKQAEHIFSSPTYKGGGYFRSATDAQRVLDELHAGTATVLGMKGNDIVVRSPTVLGYNVNVGSGFPDQLTDVFLIKGVGSPAIVPYNPTWTP